MRFVTAVLFLAIISAVVVGMAISLQDSSRRLDRAMAAAFAHPKAAPTLETKHPKPLQAGAGFGVPEP